MSQQENDPPEAEWEVIGERDNHVKLEVLIPGRRTPMRTSIKKSVMEKHGEGPEGAIKDRVQRIAAKHTDTSDVDLSGLPRSGKAQFDPREEDGKSRGRGGDPEEAGR